MLEIKEEVSRGILFLRIEGKLSNDNFNILGNKINYLLYKQGIQYYVFDFVNINKVEDNIFLKMQNKLVEIFLNCGQVVLCGISDINKKRIGYTRDRLFYVNKESEAFKYLWM